MHIGFFFSSSTWTDDYASEIKDFASFTQVSGHTPKDVADLVENATKYGLLSVIALREMPHTFHGIADELDRRGLAKHVLGWYPYDEPFLNNVPFKVLDEVGKTIKGRYPDHKLLCVFANEDLPGIPVEYDWLGFTPTYGEWLGSRHYKHRMNAVKREMLPGQEWFFCMDGGQPGKNRFYNKLFRIITNWWWARKAKKMGAAGVWWWLWPSVGNDIVGLRDMGIEKWYIKRLARRLKSGN